MATIATRSTAGITYSTAGRDAQGRYSRSPVYVVQTRRGHWYRTDDVPDAHNDTACRGCGHHGHFDYILDHQPCARPAAAADVLAALTGAR